MTSGFNQIIQTMAQADFFTGILPFILSYVIFFLALQKVPLMNYGEEKRKFTGITALIFAFFVTRFIVVNPLYQQFFVGYFGRIAIGLVGLLGLMVFLGLIGFEFEGGKMPVVILLVLIGATAAFTLSKGMYAFLPTQTLPLVGVSMKEGFNYLVNTGLLYMLIAAGGIYWATVESDGNDLNAGQSWMRTMLGLDGEKGPGD